MPLSSPLHHHRPNQWDLWPTSDEKGLPHQKSHSRRLISSHKQQPTLVRETPDRPLETTPEFCVVGSWWNFHSPVASTVSYHLIDCDCNCLSTLGLLQPETTIIFWGVLEPHPSTPRLTTLPFVLFSNTHCHYPIRSFTGLWVFRLSCSWNMWHAHVTC